MRRLKNIIPIKEYVTEEEEDTSELAVTHIIIIRSQEGELKTEEIMKRDEINDEDLGDISDNLEEDGSQVLILTPRELDNLKEILSSE